MRVFCWRAIALRPNIVTAGAQARWLGICKRHTKGWHSFLCARSHTTLASEHATLVHLLRYRAQTTPDRLAYTYLENGERESANLTWGQLDEQARAIAVSLLQHASPGDRVLLIHPSGLSFLPAFFGCMYAGFIAVPAFPPRSSRHDTRLQCVAQDSDARVVLTTQAGMASREHCRSSTPALANLTWLSTDDVDLGLAAAWRAPPSSLRGDSLAYLQYTSGSTSAAKGVMVSHGNLLFGLEDLDGPWGHTPDSVLVTWLPVFHDMGLVYGLLQALHGGFRAVLMSPEAFIQRPLRWHRAFTPGEGLGFRV